MFSVCTEVINKIIMNSFSAGLFKPVALWLWFERWDPSNHPLYRCHCGPLERNIVQSCLKTHLLTKFTNDKYSKFVNIVVAWSVFYLLDLVIRGGVQVHWVLDKHHAVFKLCNIPHLSPCLAFSCHTAALRIQWTAQVTVTVSTDASPFLRPWQQLIILLFCHHKYHIK